MIHFTVPDSIQAMCNRLYEKHFQAYVVGGCVRDSALGLTPHDYDITTDAKPEEIIALFGKENCSEYGRAFGTVGVKYAGGFAEITTFRTETDYTDYRHPGKVLFTDNILEDLSRRDFTFNAMAWNVQKQELLDPFGGLKDLQQQTLRCVGVPSARFREDPLRILRGLRFCARFGFQPELLTDTAMRAGAFLLEHISAERIFSELCNMLTGKHITEILLAYPKIFAVRIPEILPCIAFTQHTRHHDFTVWEHIARTVGNAPENLTLRLAMLFHDIEKPACFRMDRKGGHFKTHADRSAETADKILLRLRSETHLRKTVCKLIYYHRNIPQKMSDVRTVLGVLTPEEYEMLLQVFEADRISKLTGQPESPERIAKARKLFEECQNRRLCCRVKDLQIDGNALKSCGIQGKQIGEVLQYLLSCVIFQNLPNEEKSLLSAVNQWKIKQYEN